MWEQSTIANAVVAACWGLRELVGGWLKLRKQHDATAWTGQERRQDEVTFLLNKYQSLVDNLKRDYEEAKESVELLRTSFSQEAHALRGDLQARTIQLAVERERGKHLQEENRRLRGVKA